LGHKLTVSGVQRGAAMLCFDTVLYHTVVITSDAACW
jgi:hypothetical protein